MSYFHGTPITILEQSTIRNDKKKVINRRRTLGNEYEIEPVHGSRYRRKHSSKNRHLSKTKGVGVDEDGNNSLQKNKYRKHKDAGKLINDNERLMSKLQSTPESGYMEELSEKESQLTKYRNKFMNLEKSFQTVQSENLKLRETLEDREKDYDELHSHCEELMKHIQLLEQDKLNIVNGYKKIKADNNQLNEDVSLLKVLIYKLNVELERYQDKLRLAESQDHSKSPRVNESELALDHKKISESWGRVEKHVLAPLLEAYQENLEEKDDLIKQYRQELDHFSGRCKEVLCENEALHKVIEEYKSESEKFSSEMKIIQEDASIIKEENEILTKQASLQKQKLHEIHSIYERKVESMSHDNNQLHATYIACKTELSNVQGKYEILNEGFEKLKKNSEKTMPASVHTEAIEECKRLFEELKSQYETEKKKLLCQLKKYEETNPENEKMLAIMSAERDQLKHLTRNLEKNLKRTQHKLECIQSTVCSLRVSRDSFQRQLSKTTAYCEELVTEQEKLLAERKELLFLLEEREKENKNIQTLGDNIAQRMGTLKSQLKSVQKGAKEQLENVEKHIKTQELGMGKAKSDYHHELHRLKQLVKQKEDVIGKLKKEKYTTQDHLELLWKAATSENKKVKDTLENKKIYNVQL